MFMATYLSRFKIVKKLNFNIVNHFTIISGWVALKRAGWMNNKIKVFYFLAFLAEEAGAL